MLNIVYVMAKAAVKKSHLGEKKKKRSKRQEGNDKNKINKKKIVKEKRVKGNFSSNRRIQM